MKPQSQQTLEQKIAHSIDLFKKGEKLALKLNPQGYWVSFSGGKDSIVLLELAKMSGVKYTAQMQVTSLDPPALMRYVRKHHPDVKLNLPKKNFYKLIESHGVLPSRRVRYCCAELKEFAGVGYVTCIGIRKAESTRRSKRKEFTQGYKELSMDNVARNEEEVACVSGNDKILLSPIIDWTDKDVWNFIRLRNLPYCELYDRGHKRIGCILCPMARKKARTRDAKEYPGIVREIKRALAKGLAKHPDSKNVLHTKFHSDVDMIFDWWLSDMSAKQFLFEKRQMEIDWDNNK